MKKNKVKKHTTLRKPSVKVRKLFGGAKAPIIMTQLPPKAFYSNSKHVQELNSGDFNGEILKMNGAPGLIMWYADWCPHCSNKDTINLWNDIGDFCYPDVNVAAINCNNSFYGNNEVARRIGISGYPTITYVNADGSIDDKFYEGNRDKDSIIGFICEKVTQPDQLKMCKIKGR